MQLDLVALSRFSLQSLLFARLCIILICGITCFVIENYINFVASACVRACRTSSTLWHTDGTARTGLLSHLEKRGNKLTKISKRMPIFIPLRARDTPLLDVVCRLSNISLMINALIARRKHIYLLLHAISFQHTIRSANHFALRIDKHF